MPVYTESQHLPHGSARLFDLVADVERYPEFLPWVVDVRRRGLGGDKVGVDMTIAMGPLRKRFSTIGVLDRPSRIDIVSSDPLFEHFAQNWIFQACTGGGTRISHRVDFKFQSPILRKLVEAVFMESARATMSAFRRRADAVYGAQECAGAHNP